MQTFAMLNDWQIYRRNKVKKNKHLGVVMTMGCLHAGHESLLKRSIAENDETILTIFVNPTQFNNKEDFLAYPETVYDDMDFAKALGVDYILLPNYEELYPDDYTYQIMETNLSLGFEGKHRTGHFTGMLTVVMKLLQLSKAHKAYFGEKDYQQYELVNGLVKNFFLDTEIVLCDTVREASGLALSSRNKRLDSKQLDLAANLYRVLKSDLTLEQSRQELEQLGFKLDYIEDYHDRRFVAAYLDGVRLIDNIKRS